MLRRLAGDFSPLVDRHLIAKRYLEADGRVVIADLNVEGATKAARELAGEESAIGVGPLELRPRRCVAAGGIGGSVRWRKSDTQVT